MVRTAIIAAVGTIAILALVFGFLALLCTGLMPFVFFRERKLSLNGVTTMGRVAKLEEDNESGVNVHIEFMVRGGWHTLVSGASTGSYQLGQGVRVRYLPQNPDEASIDSRGRVWAGTIIVLALGFSFWVVTLIMAILRHFGVE